MPYLMKEILNNCEPVFGDADLYCNINPSYCSRTTVSKSHYFSKTSQMPILLQKWDMLVSTTISPININLVSQSDEVIQQLIQESIIECEQFRMLLIDKIIEEPKIRDKQLYVQVNQSILIRLLNKLYSYLQTTGLSEKVRVLYSTISQHMDTALNFIEDFFGNYFDRNEKVPTAYLMISINEMSRQLEFLKDSLAKSQVIDESLQSILINNFNQF